MRNSPIILLLVAILGSTGCSRSTLTVTVERYQGELILEERAQRARVASAAKAGLQWMVCTLEAAHKLRLDPQLRGKKEAQLTKLEFFLWDCIRTALTDPALRSKPPSENEIGPLDNCFKYLIVRGANGIPVGEEVWKAQKEAFQALSKELRVETKAIQQSTVQMVAPHEIKGGDLVPVEQFFGVLNLLVLERVLETTGKDINDLTVQSLIKWAEKLQALKTAISMIDPDAGDWIRSTVSKNLDEVALRKEYESANEAQRVTLFLLERLRIKVGMFDLKSPDAILTRSIGNSPSSPELLDSYRRYYDAVFELWSMLEETYIRVTGLGNFILKDASNRVDNKARAAFATEVRSRQYKGILKAEELLTDALSDNVLNALKDGTLPKPLNSRTESIRTELEKLRALESPYASVQSIGAYLALDETWKAIKAKNHPGHDLFPNWQPMTIVAVKAAAKANYVVMRDHVGNWQVKATENDPTELINAYYGGAVTTIDLAAKSFGGDVGKYLQDAWDIFKKAQESKAGPNAFAMNNLLLNLKAKHKEALDSIDKNDKTAAEKKAKKIELCEGYLSLLKTIEESLSKSRSN